MSDSGLSRRARLIRAVAPYARRLLRRGGVQPGPAVGSLLRAANTALLVSRSLHEWAWGTFVATPTFLAHCARHGEDISVEQIPDLQGPCRIEVGSQVRISGRITIQGSTRGTGRPPVLRIGSGVFIAYDCTLAVASRVELGNYVAIGAHTFISDTLGHSHRKLDVPIWEDLAEERDIAPVVIEDNVHIGHSCMILKGVRIGARSVIGAGAVVRNSVPPDTIVAGNPARVAGWRTGAGPEPAADAAKAVAASSG